MGQPDDGTSPRTPLLYGYNSYSHPPSRVVTLAERPYNKPPSTRISDEVETRHEANMVFELMACSIEHWPLDFRSGWVRQV